MSRPVNDPPTWATEDRTSAVTGSPNILEPPAEKKLVGWNPFEKPARQWLNWFMRRTGEWLTYLAGRDAYMPISTINIGVGGTNVFPDVGTGTGFIWAVNTADDTQYAFGLFFKASGDPFGIKTIANNTIDFGAVTGRNVDITGAADADLIVNSYLFPIQVYND